MSEREVRPARGPDVASIEAIWHACLREGAWEGVGRADLERALEDVARDPAGTLVSLEDEVVVGSLTTRTNDLSVAPGSRRRGHGRALLDVAVARAGARGEPYVLLYVPGGGEPPRDTPARGFAIATGMTYRAILTRMRRDGLASVADFAPAPGVTLRPLSPAEDLGPYVSMINASFADHPTYFHLDAADVARAHAAPGFDHDGIALLTARGQPDVPIAFVRTYVEPDDAGVPVGVVGHVGVLPAWRGRGLGRVLLRWALHRFSSLGLDRVELSVVAANESALRLYASEGFETIVAWPQWAKDAGFVGPSYKSR